MFYRQITTCLLLMGLATSLLGQQAEEIAMIPDDFHFEDVPLQETSFNEPASMLAGQNSHIRIQPPMVQPYRPNQYSFVIENLGTEIATDVKVEIDVPDTVRIVAALPTDTVVTDRKSLSLISKIEPSGTFELHLTATSTTDEPIEFRTKVTHSSQQIFGPRRYNAAQMPKVRIIEASGAPMNKSGISDFETREGFQSNPHYGSFTSQNGAGGNFMTTRSGTFQEPAQGFELPVPAKSASTNMTFGDFDNGPKFVEPLDSNEVEMLESPFEETPSTIESTTPGIDSNTREPEQTNLTDAPVSAKIVGAQDMTHTQFADFKIVITNNQASDLSDVLVKLQVPAAFTIHQFNAEETWYDEPTNTVSFRIPAIESNQTEVIGYRLEANGFGFQIQKLQIECGSISPAESRFDTYIE